MPVPTTNPYGNLVEDQIYVLISNEWGIKIMKSGFYNTGSQSPKFVTIMILHSQPM